MEQTEKQSKMQQSDEAKAHGYDPSKYERPSVTVDVVMMSLRQQDLQVLLIKRRSWPCEGMWAIPGGFVNMDESLYCLLNICKYEPLTMHLTWAGSRFINSPHWLLTTTRF